MRRPLRIALVGFGNVGRRFAELLPGAYARVFRALGVRPLITGIATRRHGVAVDGRGLSVRRALALVGAGDSLARLHRGHPLRTVRQFIAAVPADVLVEITPLDPHRGQPALSHVAAALGRGLHVVTANKGPVAFALRRLRAQARRRGRLFLHEGAVMDGIPVFNLVERCLPGARVLGFRGVLNSTSTLVLTRLEQGRSMAEAIREAQALGIAEADPRHDLDGHDAAVKGCALANALMGASVRPGRVKRRGMRRLSAVTVRGALRAGARVRLVVRGRRVGRRVVVSVAPERVPAGDPLAVSGADAALVLQTDLAGEVGILEPGGTIEQTAYALLVDLVRVAGEKSTTRRRRGGHKIPP